MTAVAPCCSFWPPASTRSPVISVVTSKRDRDCRYALISRSAWRAPGVAGLAAVEPVTAAGPTGTDAVSVPIEPCPGQLLPGAGLVSLSIASPMLKLPGFWRGGKSLKLVSQLPMKAWAGTSTKARSMRQRA
jgi:hypothetical protein